MKKQLLVRQSGELQNMQLSRYQDSLKRVDLKQQAANLGNNDPSALRALNREIERLRTEDSLHLERLKVKIDSLRPFVSGYPVSPFRDTIFTIYSMLGSFSPADRASAITNRIQHLTEALPFEPDSLKIQSAEFTLDIVYRDVVLTSVSDNDAIWRRSSSPSLVRLYCKQVLTTTMSRIS